MTNRQKSVDLLQNLIDQGVDYPEILEYILFNWMDGQQACQALLDAEQELLGEHDSLFIPDSDDDELDLDYDDED